MGADFDENIIKAQRISSKASSFSVIAEGLFFLLDTCRLICLTPDSLLPRVTTRQTLSLKTNTNQSISKKPRVLKPHTHCADPVITASCNFNKHDLRAASTHALKTNSNRADVHNLYGKIIITVQNKNTLYLDIGIYKNKPNEVSNHQPLDCSFSSMSWLTYKEISKLSHWIRNHLFFFPNLRWLSIPICEFAVWELAFCSTVITLTPYEHHGV